MTINLYDGARSHRDGDDYHICSTDREAFIARGFITLNHVLHENEVREIEAIHDLFASGAVPGMGRDLCDMSGTYDDRFAGFALINAMLPTRYLPESRGNVFERLSASVARQLLGVDMAFDYDQFLSKKPNQARAAFAMHQDMGYWPVGSPDTRTATCSLAITDSLRSNGCIEFVPGSNQSRKLLPHRPKASTTKSGSGGNDNNVNSDRNQSHTLEIDMPDDAEIIHQEVPRGSITVHDEWVVHGSAGNTSPRWRKTYVIAYRSRATVNFERSIGFTHSHNDTVNWTTALDLAER